LELGESPQAPVPPWLISQLAVCANYSHWVPLIVTSAIRPKQTFALLQYKSKFREYLMLIFELWNND
jgi:hypothetical protein